MACELMHQRARFGRREAHYFTQMYLTACGSAKKRAMDPPEWDSARTFLGYTRNQLLTQNFCCHVSLIPFSSPSEMSLERKNENRSTLQTIAASLCAGFRDFLPYLARCSGLLLSLRQFSPFVVLPAMTATGRRKLSRHASG